MHASLQQPPQNGITVLRLSALSAATDAVLDNEGLMEARAEAIAAAFHSERWSENLS